MKIDLNELRKRAEYISEQKHPTLDLIIWNYNQRCQFARAWDEYTKMARGLITDSEGNVIAKPFGKFFNLGESEQRLPASNPFIYPKFDGSLGILYWDGIKPCIATRGSFGSDQAIWATEWIRKMYPEANEDFSGALTYLFEIIYPQNRIVVNYGKKEALVLLAVVDAETGQEIQGLHESEAQRLNLECAKHIEYSEIGKVINNIPDDEEGYVLHWPQEGNLRIKVKGDEYVRLHRLLTQVSSKSIWELLKNNQPMDEVLDRVPDEFFAWVKQTKEKLEERFSKMYHEAIKVIDDLPDGIDRKGAALQIQKAPRDIQPIAFAILSRKPVEEIIWRKLKPEYERPFKQDIDG